MEAIGTIIENMAQDMPPDKPAVWRPSDVQTDWMLEKFSEFGYCPDKCPTAARKLAQWAVAHVKGKAGKGLILHGQRGLGKTYFCEIILKHLVPALILPILTATECCELHGDLDHDRFAERVHGSYKDNNLQITARPVVFDELGNEPVSVHYGQRQEIMATVISDRYRYWKQAGVKLFLTCNISEDDFKRRYDERVHDRLQEMCYPVYFTGESLRAK